MPSSPAAEPAGPVPDWGSRSVRELVDHVLAVHHAGERLALTRLRGLAEEAVRQDLEGRASLRKVAATLAQLSEELLEHLEREEQVLFPLLLEREAEGRTGLANWDRETELSRLHREHDHAGDLLADLRILTRDYQADRPEEGPLFAALAELDDDLQLHIELENRWLFSRAG